MPTGSRQPNIVIVLPASGTSVNIPSLPGSLIAFQFNPSEATASRIGNDLVFVADNGGKVTITGFFAVGDEPLPQLSLPDGSIVATTDFFADSGMDLSTAAGPSSNAAPNSSGAGEYADDAGSLIDGIGRLGSLGTNYWARSTNAPEMARTEALAEAPPAQGPGVIPPQPLTYNARAVAHAYDANAMNISDYKVVMDTAQWPGSASNSAVYRGGHPASYLAMSENGGKITFSLTQEALNYFASNPSAEFIEVYYSILVGGVLKNVQVVIPKNGEFDSANYQSIFSAENGNSHLEIGEWHGGKIDDASKPYDVSSTEQADWMTYEGQIKDSTIDALGGDNVVTVTGSVDNSTINADAGADTVSVTGIVKNGSIIDVGNGDNTVTVTGTVDNSGILSGSGDDDITVAGAMENGASINAGDGNNTVTVSNKMDDSTVTTGTGDDVIKVTGTMQNGSAVHAGDGKNTVTVNGTMDDSAITSGTGDDTITVTGAMENGASIDAGNGNNTVTVSNKMDDSTVTTGTGDDVIKVTGTMQNGSAVHAGDGKNTVTVNGTMDDSAITSGTGDDTITVTGAMENGASIDAGNGNNTVTVSNKMDDSTVTTGTGDDVIKVTGTMQNGSAVHAGDGKNTVTVNGAMDDSAITSGTGDDDITVTGAMENGASIDAGDGNNTVTVSNKMDDSTVTTGTGDDVIKVTGTMQNGSAVHAGDGKNTVTVNGTMDDSAITSGTGDDDITVTGAMENGASIDAGDGKNTVTVSNKMDDSTVTTGTGDDVIKVTGTMQNGSAVHAGDGKNTVTVNGTMDDSAITSGTGDDTITVSGAMENGSSINAGNGANTVTVSNKVDDSSITTGTGNDTINVTGYVQNGSAIDAGNGNNIVTVTGRVDESTIDSGTGNDTITVTGSINESEVQAGTGTNTVTVYVKESSDNKFTNAHGIESHYASRNTSIYADNKADGTGDGTVVIKKDSAADANKHYTGFMSDGTGKTAVIQGDSINIDLDNAGGATLLAATNGGKTVVQGDDTAHFGLSGVGAGKDARIMDATNGGKNEIKDVDTVEFTMTGGDRYAMSATGDGSENTITGADSVNIDLSGGGSDGYALNAEAKGKNSFSTGQLDIDVASAAGGEAMGLRATGGGQNDVASTGDATINASVTGSGGTARALHAEGTGPDEANNTITAAGVLTLGAQSGNANNYTVSAIANGGDATNELVSDTVRITAENTEATNRNYTAGLYVGGGTGTATNTVKAHGGALDVAIDSKGSGYLMGMLATGNAANSNKVIGSGHADDHLDITVTQTLADTNNIAAGIRADGGSNYVTDITKVDVTVDTTLADRSFTSGIYSYDGENKITNAEKVAINVTGKSDVQGMHANENGKNIINSDGDLTVTINATQIPGVTYDRVYGMQASRGRNEITTGSDLDMEVTSTADSTVYNFGINTDSGETLIQSDGDMKLEVTARNINNEGLAIALGASGGNSSIISQGKMDLTLTADVTGVFASTGKVAMAASAGTNLIQSGDANDRITLNGDMAGYHSHPTLGPGLNLIKTGAGDDLVQLNGSMTTYEPATFYGKGGQNAVYMGTGQDTFNITGDVRTAKSSHNTGQYMENLIDMGYWKDENQNAYAGGSEKNVLNIGGRIWMQGSSYSSGPEIGGVDSSKTFIRFGEGEGELTVGKDLNAERASFTYQDLGGKKTLSFNNADNQQYAVEARDGSRVKFQFDQGDTANTVAPNEFTINASNGGFGANNLPAIGDSTELEISTNLTHSRDDKLTINGGITLSDNTKVSVKTGGGDDTVTINGNLNNNGGSSTHYAKLDIDTGQSAGDSLTVNGYVHSKSYSETSLTSTELLVNAKADGGASAVETTAGQLGPTSITIDATGKADIRATTGHNSGAHAVGLASLTEDIATGNAANKGKATVTVTGKDVDVTASTGYGSGSTATGIKSLNDHQVELTALSPDIDTALVSAHTNVSADDTVNVKATGEGGAYAMRASNLGAQNSVEGTDVHLEATARGGSAYGVAADIIPVSNSPTYYGGSQNSIKASNQFTVDVNAQGDAYGLYSSIAHNWGATRNETAFHGNTVSAANSRITATSTQGNAYALYAGDGNRAFNPANLKEAGNKVTADSVELTAEGRSDRSEAYGIFAQAAAASTNVDIVNTITTKDLDITAKGVTVNGMMAQGNSATNTATNSIIAKDDTLQVDIIADGSAYSYGMHATGASGSNIIDGGAYGGKLTVTAKGDGYSTGLRADKGANKITGLDEVSITADADKGGYGIISSGGDNLISGAHTVSVTAKGDEQVHGILVQGGKTDITNSGDMKVMIDATSSRVLDASSQHGDSRSTYGLRTNYDSAGSTTTIATTGGGDLDLTINATGYALSNEKPSTTSVYGINNLASTSSTIIASDADLKLRVNAENKYNHNGYGSATALENSGGQVSITSKGKMDLELNAIVAGADALKIAVHTSGGGTTHIRSADQDDRLVFDGTVEAVSSTPAKSGLNLIETMAGNDTVTITGNLTTYMDYPSGNGGKNAIYAGSGADTVTIGGDVVAKTYTTSAPDGYSNKCFNTIDMGYYADGNEGPLAGATTGIDRLDINGSVIGKGKSHDVEGGKQPHHASITTIRFGENEGDLNIGGNVYLEEYAEFIYEALGGKKDIFIDNDQGKTNGMEVAYSSEASFLFDQGTTANAVANDFTLKVDGGIHVGSGSGMSSPPKDSSSLNIQTSLLYDRDDTLTIEGGLTVSNKGSISIETGGGNDEVTITGGITANSNGKTLIDLGEGDDTLILNGGMAINPGYLGTAHHDVLLGEGNDTIVLNGGTYEGLHLDGGAGTDKLVYNIMDTNGNGVMDELQTLFGATNEITGIEEILLNASGNGSNDILDLGDLLDYMRMQGDRLEDLKLDLKLDGTDTLNSSGISSDWTAGSTVNGYTEYTYDQGGSDELSFWIKVTTV